MSIVTPWFVETFQDFTGRLLNKKLHHGLLLSGPDGLGKRQFAESLAQTILCQQPTEQGMCGQCQSCLLYKAGTHPDRLLVESDKQIGIDQIRQVTTALNQTAQISATQVCIIANAHDITEPAANALLKTLEEPTFNTYLVLLSHRPATLLPTLLSRCEKHTFRTPSERELIAWLRAQDIDTQLVTQELLEACAFSPRRVKEALEQGEAALYIRWKNDLTGLLNGTTPTVKVAASWAEHSEQVLIWCQQWLRNQLSSAENADSTENTYMAFRHIVALAKQLERPGINRVVLLDNGLNVLKDLSISY